MGSSTPPPATVYGRRASPAASMRRRKDSWPIRSASGVASISVRTASSAEPNLTVPARVRVPVTRRPAASNSDPTRSRSPRTQ